MILQSASGLFTLDHDGTHYELEVEPTGLLGNTARLFADGEQAAGVNKDLEPLKLETDQLKITVTCDLFHRVKKLVTVTKEGDEPLYFSPPEGSLMAKLERLEREKPVLYASRHVGLAAGKLVAGLLGIGAIFKLLLPRIPWPDIDLPDVRLPKIDLPDVPWPDLDIPWPDLELPAWMKAVLATAKWWGPIVAAIFVALHEVDKNRKKHAKKEADAKLNAARTDTETVSKD